MAGYSGETEVRPQSSQRRYRTGSASERPMTRALGTPQRGQTMPEVERLAIGLLLTPLFRLRIAMKDTRFTKLGRVSLMSFVVSLPFY